MKSKKGKKATAKVKDKPNCKLKNGAVQFFEKYYTYDPAGVPIDMTGNTLVCWRGVFYSWRKGKYTQISDGQMKATIVQYLRAGRITAKPNTVNEIMLNLQGIALLDSEIQPDSWLRGIVGPRVIVAQNGNISFDDLDRQGRPKLLPHTPNYFTFVRLPYRYIPKAKCPKWFRFLDEVMDGDSKQKRLLQQWTGYTLTLTLREQRFLICVGEGANGKGVFFVVIIAMLGPENCSSLPLSRFGQNFALSSTYGKLLNATNEGIGEITPHAEAILKEYTAGDMMTFERKYKEPFYAIPTAKLMFATNELPRFKDKTQGVWRRMLLVPFDVTISEDQQNKNLAEELKAELPGIFNWAYDGMLDLEKNGFVIPTKSKRAIKQYRRDVNPAKTFLTDNYKYQPDAEGIPRQNLYKQYTAWCRSNGYGKLNDAEFGKEVRHAFPKTKKRRLGGRRNRTMCYVGLANRNGPENQW